MSIEDQGQRDELPDSIVSQFNNIIKSQEQLNLRISKIISFGIVAFIVLSCSVIYLTWSLQQDMERSSGYMEEMVKGVSSMNDVMGQMQTNMNAMEEGINNVASHTNSISHSIVQPDNSVAVLSYIADSVKLMQGDARGLNKSIDEMNYNLNNINKQMKSLNRKLGTIAHDSNRMPSPGNMFPF